MNTMKDFKNTLLKRREVKVLIQAEKNPGFQQAIQIIAQQFKVTEDVIAVKIVKSKFGRDTFLIDAFIYNSPADKLVFEPKPKVKTGVEALKK